MFGTNTYHLNTPKHSHGPGETTIATFTIQLNLGQGNYSLCIAVHSGDTHLENNYDWWDQCLVFQMIPNNSFKFIGIAALPVEVEIQKGESGNNEGSKG